MVIQQSLCITLTYRFVKIVNTPTACTSPHFNNLSHLLATEKPVRQIQKVTISCSHQRGSELCFQTITQSNCGLSCPAQSAQGTRPKATNPLVPPPPPSPHLMGQMALNPVGWSLFKAATCAQAKMVYPCGIRELLFYLQSLTMNNDKITLLNIFLSEQ